MIGDLKARIGELEGSEGDANAMIGDLKAQLGALEGSNGDANAMIGDLKAQIGELEGSNGDLNTKVGELMASGEGLDAQLVDANRELADLRAQLDASRTATANADAAGQELNDRINDLQSQLEASQANAEQQQGVASEKAQMAQDLQTQLASANSNAEEQTQLAQNLAERLAALQNQRPDQSGAQALRDQLVAALEANGVDGPQVDVRPDNSVGINLRSEALFNSGRARLNAAGRNLMQRVSAALGDFTSNPIRIEGHTDSIPVTGSLQQIFPSNWELSVARAANAVSFMQSAGDFNPTNLSASGFGEFRPVAGNDTREGRALNRRIEVVVSPTN